MNKMILNRALIGKFVREKSMNEIYFVYHYFRSKSGPDLLIRPAGIRSDRMAKREMEIGLPASSLVSKDFKKWWEIIEYKDKLAHNVIKNILQNSNFWTDADEFEVIE